MDSLSHFFKNYSNGTNDFPQCKFDCGHLFESFSDAYDVVHKPLALAICIFGIAANLMNVVVLTRREMQSPTNILLTGLSAAQLFLLLNYLLLLLYNYLTENCYAPSMIMSEAWPTYKLVNVNLSVVFHSTALAHTLCLAIFRFMGMRLPHYAVVFSNLSRARRCVVVLYTVTPFLCCLMFMTTYVGKVTDDPCCGLQEYFDLKYADNEDLFQTTLWIYGVVFKLVPSLAICVLSLSLIKSLKIIDIRHNRLTRRKNIKRKMYRLKLSKMFVAVALLCVAVELPHGVINLFTASFGAPFGREIYDKLGDFLEMLTLLYSSVNFMLYCFMNSGFQCTFKRIMLRNHCKYLCIHSKYVADSPTAIGDSFFGRKQKIALQHI